jgi:hypothetical protein
MIVYRRDVDGSEDDFFDVIGSLVPFTGVRLSAASKE